MMVLFPISSIACNILHLFSNGVERFLSVSVSNESSSVDRHSIFCLLEPSKAFFQLWPVDNISLAKVNLCFALGHAWLQTAGNSNFWKAPSRLSWLYPELLHESSLPFNPSMIIDIFNTNFSRTVSMREIQKEWIVWSSLLHQEEKNAKFGLTECKRFAEDDKCWAPFSKLSLQMTCFSSFHRNYNCYDKRCSTLQ